MQTDDKDFHTSITVASTPGQVIDGINNISGWWATNFRGSARQLHDQFTVRFGKTYSTLEVVEMTPDKMVWKVVDCLLPLFKNETQWKDTYLAWDISPKGKSTQITFTHRGLTPALECFQDCEKGWTFYIQQSLGKFLTENKGIPGTGIFARLIRDDRRYEGLIYFKNDPIPHYPEGYLYLDVKETNGEEVVSAYMVDYFHQETFCGTQLKGDYFMIIENRSLIKDISPLNDILQTIK